MFPFFFSTARDKNEIETRKRTYYPGHISTRIIDTTGIFDRLVFNFAMLDI
jgi:hypothetical protein